MPRSEASNPLRSFRFQGRILDDPENGYQGTLNSPGINAEAGFASITGGEISTDTATYREGIDIWTKKYAGPPTVSSITMTRGMVLRETDMWEWCLAMVEGRPHKADLQVCLLPNNAWARSSAAPRINTASTLPAGWLAASRVITYYDCHPSRFKIPDMDANTSDVAVQEIEVEPERFDFTDPSAAPG